MTPKPTAGLTRAVPTRSLKSMDTQKQAVLSLMLMMSRKDIAELRAAAEGTNVELTTGPGSANEQLWSMLEQLGWLEVRLPVSAAGEAAIPAASRTFAVTPAGMQPIAELLTSYAEERPKVDKRMLEIANDLCRPFATQLVQKVRSGGGGLNDVGVLLALAFEGALRDSVRPDQRKQWAGNLLEDMKRCLVA